MIKPNTILIVHQGAELYGSDRMLLQMLNSLQDKHHALTLHIPCDGPLATRARPLVQTLCIAPISILRFAALKSLHWLSPISFVRNLTFARHQLHQHNIVIVNSCVILTYLLLLPFYRGRKFVYVHELPVGFIKIMFNSLLYLTGATIICNSRATAQAYPLIPAHRKKIVYNAAPLPEHAPPDKQISQKLNLLLIGRISHRKGQHVLIQALQTLPQNTLDKFAVRIVGDSFRPHDTYQTSILNDVQKLKSVLDITHHPFTAQPNEHYEWAHVVIVPSIKPESFGLVVLEAMQHRCAVIASAIGALPELVMDYETGLLVEPDNAYALANALQFYSENPEIIITHGRQGLAKATTEFSNEQYKHSLQQVIHV